MTDEQARVRGFAMRLRELLKEFDLCLWTDREANRWHCDYGYDVDVTNQMVREILEDKGIEPE